MLENSKISNWEKLCQISDRRSGRTINPKFRFDNFDYALKLDLMWYRGELAAAYDIVLIMQGAPDLPRAVFEIAQAVNGGALIFSPVQKTRFWADVQRGMVVAWEHATPHITGVIIRPDGKAQIPVYDWQDMLEAVAAATDMTQKLKAKLKSNDNASLQMAEEHCRKYLLDSTSEALPAYQL